MKLKRRIRVAAVLCVVGVGGSLVISPPAWASVNKSAFAAGYYAGPGGITQATSSTAQYVLPKVICAARENAAISPTVVVSGAVDMVLAGIRLECVNGKVTYQPSLLINGVRSLPALTLKAGDKIKETATQNGSGASALVQDLSTGKSVKSTGAGSTKDTYGDIQMNWVAKPSNSKVPQAVPNFGHLTFTGAKLNGIALGSLNTGESEMYSGGSDPVPPSAHLLIATSSISHGTTFTATFVRST